MSTAQLPLLQGVACVRVQVVLVHCPVVQAPPPVVQAAAVSCVEMEHVPSSSQAFCDAALSAVPLQTPPSSVQPAGHPARFAESEYTHAGDRSQVSVTSQFSLVAASA